MPIRPASLPLSASAADVVRIAQAPGTEPTLIRDVAHAFALDGPPLSPEQATTLAKTLASALMSRDATLPSASAAPNSLPPPFRGAALSAQAPVLASIAPDAVPHDAAEQLLAATDGALARQTLLQVASLPDQPDLPRAEVAQRWSFEVPFATPQGTAIAQFEVSRDGRAPRPTSTTTGVAGAFLARCRADGSGARDGRTHRRTRERIALGRASLDRDATQ